jgi:hypothetical protein
MGQYCETPTQIKTSYRQADCIRHAAPGVAIASRGSRRGCCGDIDTEPWASGRSGQKRKATKNSTRRKRVKVTKNKNRTRRKRVKVTKNKNRHKKTSRKYITPLKTPMEKNH